MKITDIYESTTAGAIATVATPMTTQSRNASIYGSKKGGNLLTGKKSKAKYANSISESKMKQVASDLETMQDGNFKQKYGKTKEQIKMLLGDPEAKKTMQEAAFQEGRDGLQQKMTPMQALLGAYSILISFGTQYLDEKGETPEAQKQLLALVQRLQKDKTLIGLDNKKIEANRDAILKHIHQMMTYAIPILQKYLPAAEFAAKRSQINGILTAYNAARQVNEAHLEEDDLIIVPGQGHRLKSGFIPHDQDRTDHEVEMAKSDLFQAAKNAKTVYELIADVSEDEGLEGWVQEKIIKANDYLNTVREYLEHKMLQNETAGVIAGGGVGESLANWNMGIQSIPRTSEWKRKAITAISPGPWPKEYTFDTEQEAIQHFTKAGWEKIKAGVPTKSGKPWQVIYADDVTEGVKEKIKGVIRREKSKDMPLVQTRRDYAMGKAGDAYNKGEIRKGNQYSAYAEKDRKKKGDPTTNPAGTYRTKTSDYTNEGEDKQGDEYKAWRKKNFNDKKTTDKIVKGSDTRTKYDLDEAQSMGAALKNTLAKAEPGSKLDNSIKSHNRHIKAGLPGTLKNAPTGYHFDSKGYCRLGDK